MSAGRIVDLATIHGTILELREAVALINYIVV